MGSPSTWPGGPDSSTRPPSRKQTVSATCLANPISCVAIRIVIPPAASSRTIASTSPTSSGSSAEVISSRSSRRGRTASARAIATRCCCPPESRSGCAPAKASSPTRASSSRARSSASRAGTPCTTRGASVTLSSTVMCGKRLNAWKTIPIRRCAAATSARGSETSTPSRSTWPSSISSKQVDAPQQRRLARPGRSDERDDPVLLDGQVDPAQHRCRPVVLDQVADLEDGCHASPCRRAARAARASAMRPVGAASSTNSSAATT